MTKAQRDAIASPATGLLIFQTNSTPGFYYYDGSGWNAVTPKAKGWSLTGNTGTNPLTNFIGTTDAKSLEFKVNNLRAGLIDYSTFNTGTRNTAFGQIALNSLTSGADNTAMGYGSLYTNTTGNQNVAYGKYALFYNNANDNAAYGFNALFFNTTGAGNTAIGITTLQNNTTGSNNVAVGYYALGNNFTGSNNTAIGFGAQVGAPGLTNATAIGSNATVDISNAVVLGNNANVGIGMKTPGYKLVVTDNRINGPTAYIQNLGNSAPSANDGMWIQAGSNGGGVIGSSYYVAFQRPDGNLIGAVTQVTAGSVAYNTTSDKRLKTNIRETKFGLAAVNKIEVKDYNFIGSKEEQTGFLAQQLYEVFPEAVTKGGDDPKTRPWMVDYGRVTPLLVKAVQELSKINDDKEVKIDAQDKKIADLQNQINELKAMIVSNQSTINSQQSTVISSASLQQNIPNPFTNSTTINYTLPQKFASAQIVITDKNGKTLKAVTVSGSGKGTLNVNASTLASGAYQYSLMINGRLIDTKQMLVAK